MPIEGRNTVINEMPNLTNENIYMKNSNNVIKKIKKIREDGIDKLQVVSDFDLTMTKQHVNGKDVLSSFGIFYRCKQLPQTIKDSSTILYQKYRPIEVDPHLALDEKIRAMEDWMQKTETMLQGIDFDKSEINEVAKIYGTSLRDGTMPLIQRLNVANVPVLVFSAGLGDVVKAVLENHNILLDNALDPDYFKVLEDRTNVILMGDMTGDATMADGVKLAETILKIGFLYDNVQQKLPSYMDAFDIVLVDDQTMNVATDILQQML
ncbi:7-methylguanosine phosphate-specific 5'-nucleotidase isoform X2 [Aphidius gifuensis]|uniref:7-methylguanosine phosphate-specific 5'-nucleotidase isoform X2 n=1 Tax=Aphidius gifuensis TaxID=684658 RepID=UPI001CDC7244|nr:7-methylguanosine phosphate-specific 5'-nucleotidase isoform X2 [Aphidius gifuensis]